MSSTAQSPHAFFPGTPVCGDFIIERLEHQTRLGRLYSARARAPGASAERFEVRVPYTSSVGSAVVFREQIGRIGKVHHRAVAEVVRCGIEGVGPVVVTRSLAAAPTLRERLAEGPPLPPGEVSRIVSDVAEALDAFHAQREPVVHRVLSPSEIRMDPVEGTVLVSACGLVHALTVSRWLDHSNEDLIDPWYLSPDALLAHLHPRMDTFVLASIAFECLTGVPAFPNADDHAAILKGWHPRARAVLPGLSPAVDAALSRAWSSSTPQAYERTTEFAADLALALKQGPVRAHGTVTTAAGRAPPPLPLGRPVLSPGRSSVLDLDLDDSWMLHDDLPVCQTVEWSAVTRGPPPGDAAPTVKPPASSTIAPPPAYPDWAGRVSRPGAVLDAPPKDDSTAPPVILVRRSERARRRPRKTLLSVRATQGVRPKIAPHGALYLSGAIVAAAFIITAGRIYVSRAVHAPTAAPVVRILAPVSAPSPAAQSAPSVLERAPATPVVAADAEPTSLAALRERMSIVAGACVGVGTYPHHIRLRVYYDPGGHPTRAEVHGVFAVPPYVRCIERAALSLSLPPDAHGTARLEYSFVAPPRS